MFRDGHRNGQQQIFGCAVLKRERNRRWYEENPEYQRRYREENREKSREYSRRWRRENPEKKQESNAKRIQIGATYLGMCGFTKTEREAMLSGTSK